jgi:uncharacterized protein (TIGR03492 family)
MSARVLLVSNGHGEASIAERIAVEIRTRNARIALDHFPLVGTGVRGGVMTEVGPRREMPSGGLVAMGNVRAFAQDVAAGFPALFARQVAFLRGRGAYDLAIAVGDAYALAMALVTRAATAFVGTAKSAYVAPYGAVERSLMRRARRVFVRDERTAADLRSKGVPAEAPGNVIVDLHRADEPAFPGEFIGLLPGSRADAYHDAVLLGRVLRALAHEGGCSEALISVAPTIDAARLADGLEADGWAIDRGESPVPFVARSAGSRLVAWDGPLGRLLGSSRIVVGQAGTANEAAAAGGIPVVALDAGGGWYRMRQRRLLGDALVTVPAAPEAAAAAIAALLRDPARLQRMRDAGPERLGPAGGAAGIAVAAIALLPPEAVAS